MLLKPHLQLDDSVTLQRNKICGAASWEEGLAGAVLLTQPEPKPKLRPVRGEGCGKGGVEAADAPLTLGDDLLLGGLEGGLQLCVPVEGDLGGEQLAEGGHDGGRGEAEGDLVHCP